MRVDVKPSLEALEERIFNVTSQLDAGRIGGRAATTVLDGLARLDTVLAALDVAKKEEVPQEILALAAERDAARKAKEYARADAFRDELRGKGWLVEDTPSGPRLKLA